MCTWCPSSCDVSQEKRKRKLIRAAKQKWNGTQKADETLGAETAAVADEANGNGIGNENKNEERISRQCGNEDDVHVGGDKIAEREVINDHINDTESAGMMIADLDPPTPPLLTPDPPDPSAMMMEDDLYDPVYEIYLMLMREDNAGDGAIEAIPPGSYAYP